MFSPWQVAIVIISLLGVQLLSMEYVLSRMATESSILAAVEHRVARASKQMAEDEEGNDLLMRELETRLLKKLVELGSRFDVARLHIDALQSQMATLDRVTRTEFNAFIANSHASRLINDDALRALDAERLDLHLAPGRTDVSFVVPMHNVASMRVDVETTLRSVAQLVVQSTGDWWLNRPAATIDVVFVCRSALPAGDLHPDALDFLSFGRLRIVARLMCVHPIASLMRAAIAGAAKGSSDLVVFWNPLLRVLRESRLFLSHFVTAAARGAVLGAITVARNRSSVLCSGVEFERGTHRPVCKYDNAEFAPDVAWWQALDSGVEPTSALCAFPIAVSWSTLVTLATFDHVAGVSDADDVLAFTLRAWIVGDDVSLSSAAFDVVGAPNLTAQTRMSVPHALAAPLASKLSISPITVVWDVEPGCRHSHSTSAINAIADLHRNHHSSISQMALRAWCEQGEKITLDRFRRAQFDGVVDVWISFRMPFFWPEFKEKQPRIAIGRIATTNSDVVSMCASREHIVDEIWVPTVDVRRALIAAGVDSKKVVIMRDSVDVGVYHPFVDRAGGSPDLQTLLGRLRTTRILAPTTASASLLYAFLSVFNATSDVSLILWGDEVEEKELLMGMVAQSAPHVVTVSDSLSPKDVVALYAEADYFMTEAYSVRTLEALAMAVPVIAPSSDAMREVGGADDMFLLPCVVDNGQCVSVLKTFVDAMHKIGRGEYSNLAAMRGPSGAARAKLRRVDGIGKLMIDRINTLLETVAQ
jgi:hypothetical protein